MADVKRLRALCASDAVCRFEESSALSSSSSSFARRILFSAVNSRPLCRTGRIFRTLAPKISQLDDAIRDENEKCTGWEVVAEA